MRHIKYKTQTTYYKLGKSSYNIICNNDKNNDIGNNKQVKLDKIRAKKITTDNTSQT